MTQFTVNAKDLSDALNLALASIETKTTIPILMFVLFESDGKEVRLTTTDMDTFTSLNLPVSETEKGSFCVPAKQLRDLVSLMDGDVKVSVEGGVTVQCGMSVYQLPIREAADFPQIERAEHGQGSISGQLFSDMVRAAAIAASTNPNDTEISKSILIAAKDEKLSIVGCDQKRLALAQTQHDGEFHAVMPLDSALGLAAFALQSESVEIFCSESHFTLRSDKGDAGTRLLVTKWPNWEMIIPKTHEHEIELDPALLSPIIKRAALTTDGVLAGLKFTLGKKSAVITTRTPDYTGKESFPIDCPSLNGDDFIIGIPGRQILDLFKVCKGKVSWTIQSPTAQVSFKPVDCLTFDFQYIVMPIRVDAL